MAEINMNKALVTGILAGLTAGGVSRFGVPGATGLTSAIAPVAGVAVLLVGYQTQSLNRGELGVAFTTALLGWYMLGIPGKTGPASTWPNTNVGVGTRPLRSLSGV